MVRDAVGSRSTGLLCKLLWYNIEGIMAVLMKLFSILLGYDTLSLGKWFQMFGQSW
jgi:hypothetical protein